MKLFLFVVGIFMAISLFACEDKEGQETATEDVEESQTEQSEEESSSQEESSESSE